MQCANDDDYRVEDPLARLLDVFRMDLLGRQIASDMMREERNAILQGLPRIRPRGPGVAAHRMPACDFLAAAVGAAAAGPTVRIVAALAPLLDDLRWSYGYPVDPKWPDLGSRVAFAQLVGSRGLTDDDFVNLGLTLMAPRTHYPLHAHPAIEVYLVLSGTAGWRIQGQPFRTQPPGSLLLHRSGIGHAMLTNAEPLLALYVWRGDLATAPIYVEDT